MAQKFGNGRWVREGFLDNRAAGTVVGRIHLAAIGAVDVFLRGDFRGEIAGQAIRFRNSRFEDDELAAQVLGDLESPQVGTVNLISFDPHPNLQPHPYIEWFSMRKNHYRIELTPGDAWIASPEELADIDRVAGTIRNALAGLVQDQPRRREDSEWI